MNTAAQLSQQLEAIDRKSYPAYKSLKGMYQFPEYILCIDHVQGDPFAAPSKIHVEINREKAAFPESLYDVKHKKIAVQDYLLRTFKKSMDSYLFRAKGSGKSGLMSISSCGQVVLERTALEITPQHIVARLEVGFPANGRTINAKELKKIMFEFLPECVRSSLYYQNINQQQLKDAVALSEDQDAIRQELKHRNLIAFVANDSILPRESGVSDKPMKGAVAFESPKELEVELKLPNKGTIKGMGIPKGITLIVGGGYHGKSTLLKALEVGVYNHIAGDGREYVITEDSAMKIRAEDSRSVARVDISSFINHLPNGKDTVHFTTEDASGSTSQAANVVEAVEADAKVLLIDEDTSATNFMVRDALMQAVIAKEKEPITPFIERAYMLYEQLGVSVVLVAGSSGAYFSIADYILQMDTYQAYDITEAVKEICSQLDEGYFQEDMEKDTYVVSHKKERLLRVGNLEKKHGQIRLKQLGKTSFAMGKETIDLKYVEQIADAEQTMALGYCLKHIVEEMEGKKAVDIHAIMEEVWKRVKEKGITCIVQGSYTQAPVAMIRKQELYACVNRYRGFCE